MRPSASLNSIHAHFSHEATQPWQRRSLRTRPARIDQKHDIRTLSPTTPVASVWDGCRRTRPYSAPCRGNYDSAPPPATLLDHWMTYCSDSLSSDRSSRYRSLQDLDHISECRP